MTEMHREGGLIDSFNLKCYEWFQQQKIDMDMSNGWRLFCATEQTLGKICDIF